MIDLIVAGKKDVVSREHAGPAASIMPSTALPRFTLSDLAGAPITADQLAGASCWSSFGRPGVRRVGRHSNGWAK
jgi:hypothetical protein